MRQRTNTQASLQSLQQIELFSGLPQEELQHLSSLLQCRHAPKGTCVCREGDPSDALYIIETGQVKVYKEAARKRVLIATLGPGTPFGDMALLTGEPRVATVEVSIDADLWVLAKEDFDQALHRYPAIAINLSRILAKRLRLSNEERVFGASDDYNRLVMVVGPVKEALLLAGRVAAFGSREALVVDLASPGGGRVDSLDPLPSVVPVSEGLSRLNIGVEFDGDELSEMVSLLLRKFDHVVVHLPDTQKAYTAEALDVAEVVIAYGRRQRPWLAASRSQPSRLWTVGEVGDPGYDEGRAGRDRDRLARRLVGRSVGLALSSGAAHGLAHIGVLRVLEAEGVPIDLISGTSIGSLISTAYAAGRNVEELYDIGKETAQLINIKVGWRFWDFTFSRSGLVRGDMTKKKIVEWTKGKRFEDVEIPVFIVAAEVLSGRAVTFSKGSLAAAARASISIPGLFKPVPYGDDFLIDGGAVDPVPCRPLADAGADIIIACNVIPQVEDRLYRGVRRTVQRGLTPSIFEITGSEREMMAAQVAILKMNPYDVLIAPKVGRYSWTEARRIDEFVRLGEEAARTAIPQIKALLQPGARKVRRR
ncbi:MAG TPA: cyclic nucleotide-binding and patatin-like phospholipase domain-containing protein [Chloroflexia bacterium]|nr:cyclic nucleotide-binding and patatin-like phospholipase domain-containing protein [Chloroflexia bacterium]